MPSTKDPSRKVNARDTKPQQQQQRQQHSCRNCTKQYSPGRASCPAKDSQCQACGKMGHWKAKCKTTKRKQAANGQCMPSTGQECQTQTEQDPWSWNWWWPPHGWGKGCSSREPSRDWDGISPEPSRGSCSPPQWPTLMTRWHHYHCRCEDKWNWSLCQPSRYQPILGNADLQLFDARLTLVLVAMSCPSAHSQNFSQNGLTQMDTQLDSLHQPHA